jgi:hypothetical protein
MKTDITINILNVKVTAMFRCTYFSSPSLFLFRLSVDRISMFLSFQPFSFLFTLYEMLNAY